MNGAPLTASITDQVWNGLAGALRFENGDPPWYSYLPNHAAHVCAAYESVEVHRYGGDADASWQFSHTPLTSLMGRAIAETTIAVIEKMGLEPAMEKLGFERVI